VSGAQSINNTPANLSNNDFENASSVIKYLGEDEVPDECPLKNNNELYCYDRETAKTLMYLIGKLKIIFSINNNNNYHMHAQDFVADVIDNFKVNYEKMSIHIYL